MQTTKTTTRKRSSNPPWQMPGERIDYIGITVGGSTLEAAMTALGAELRRRGIETAIEVHS